MSLSWHLLVMMRFSGRNLFAVCVPVLPRLGGLSGLTGGISC